MNHKYTAAGRYTAAIDSFVLTCLFSVKIFKNG